MKRHIAAPTALAVAFFIYFLSACKNDFGKYNGGTPVRAELVTFDSTSLNDPSEVPKFRYGVQTFSSLTNVDNLSGPRFKMLQGGELEVKESVGTVITSSEFGGYSIPSLDYRTVDGVVKPLTTQSVTMLSAVFQFDALIAKIEALSGKKHDAFFQGYDAFSILYHPSVEISGSGEQLRRYESSNAAYVAGAKQFALYFVGENERIPMSYNPQILAHEFGHAIFERTFFNNKFERCTPGELRTERLFPGRIESEYVVRGINEGFSDFVSFVWTGSSNILQSSIGDGTLTRERDFSKSSFDFDTFSLKEGQVCQGRFYCIGTLWARVLLDVFKSRALDPKNSESREKFLREVVGILEQTGTALRESEGDRLPDPDYRAQTCQNRDFVSASADGEMLSAFFTAFLENVEAANRKGYCTAIDKHFGISGFPTAARRGCT